MAEYLNPEQKQASEALPGPLLIVAGAGTGKTRTLTRRIAHFIEKGTPPGKICAITFTNKAANEMRERISANGKSPGVNHNAMRLATSALPFIGTFHSLGAKILREETRFLRRKKNFVIFDDHDSFDLIKKIWKKTIVSDKKEGGTGRREGKLTPSFFAQEISKLKNLDRGNFNGGRGGYRENIPTAALTVFERYEKTLADNNAFDFDDLIEKPVRLFQEHPDILKKYRDKFDAIFVDEYQDLSPMQYEFVKLLAGSHRNLSVVGDDEQMIYGWRFADLKIFLNFEKDWPGARVAFLEENYRSSGNIIAAAAEVAKNNVFRAPKNLWTKNPAGAQIKVAEFFDENREAEWIAEKIFNFQFSISEQETTAVLYRINAQSRALEQALIRRRIPYKIFGGTKFYERREVKDIVAALRYASNKNDSMSRERLEKNFSKSKFRTLAAALVAEKIGSPEKLIEIFLKSTDYLEYLEKNFINYAERQENIGELVNFASRFKNLTQFLEEITLVQATDDIATIQKNTDSSGKNGRGANDTSSVVNLMTIHLAKGLEFDNVFIAGCAEGLLPHARSIENDERLEEERRLMYVAMTRARKELAIGFYDVPSRFLSEIPQELIELENRMEDSYGDERSISLDE